MTALIARLRSQIGDPAGATQTFSDDDLQRLLDGRRRDVRYRELTGVETRLPGGSYETTEYHADRRPWESDAALYDGDYDSLNPAAADLINGIWTFDSDTPAPVFVSGQTYDMAAAAADALEEWAARVSREFQFQAGPDIFHREQKIAGLLAAAERFRAQSLPGAGSFERSDLATC